MSKALNPQKALIFRIVHKDNIEPIIMDGCFCRNLGKTSYVEIGNQELIQKRNSRPVPCGPGGTLSDYVPFYFTPYSPMLYAIKTGHGVPKKPVSEIVILISSLPLLSKQGIQFVFTDRHAYLKTALFSNNLADLNRIIWPVLQARDFRRDDLEKFEKYQAEALVFQRVPVSAFLGIVCYNEAVRSALQSHADKHSSSVKILAQPQWFL